MQKKYIKKLKDAQQTVCDALANMKYGPGEWKATIVDPMSDQVNIDGSLVDNRAFNDYEKVVSFYRRGHTSSKELITYKPDERYLLKELLFMAKHMDWRTHSLILSRCSEEEIKAGKCFDCKEFRKAHPLPKGFPVLPSLSKNNALYFEPEVSQQSSFIFVGLE